MHGAMYVTRNFIVSTHTDPDRSWTVVLVLGGERGGVFYSAAHKWAVELKPCTMFWFRGCHPHGTSDCADDEKVNDR